MKSKKISLVSNLRLSQKIWGLVIISTVIMAFLAVISLIVGVRIESDTTREAKLSEFQVPLTQLNTELMRNRMNISDICSVPNEVAPEIIQVMHDTDAKVLELYTEILNMGGAESLPPIVGFDQKYQDWISFRDKEITPLVQNKELAQYFTLATAKGPGSNQEQIANYTAMVDNSQQMMLKEMAQARSDVIKSRTILRTSILGAGILGIIIMSLLGWSTVQSITRPLRVIQNSLNAMSQGDLTQNPQVTSHDEIGQMAQSLTAALASLRGLISHTVETVHQVEGTVKVVKETSDQAVAAAASSQDDSQRVAAQADEVSSSIQTVAAGSEEMNASIREISSNANDAARFAADAAQAAQETNEVVSRLGDSSQEIGEVIKSITSIAEQTNLLALNATIEAARAGDAGKGFAVVAGEVKDLASETAKATEDIGTKIEKIKSDTDDAVQAIGKIGEIISSINDFQTTIAAAVEEQTATTNEMSRSVSEAAEGSSTIAASISSIAQAASGAAQTLSSINQSTQELSKHSEYLKTQIGNFKF